ncbi:ABC-type transport auxiliary lipoprotein family protein [Pseudomonadota bacterium]
MMKSKKTVIVLTLVVFLVSACSGVMDSKQPARQYYLLSPDTTLAAAESTAPGPGLSLNVSVIPGLDTDRVLALSPDARMGPYANARWPDHLPEVITSVLRRSLTASGRFSSVQESTRRSEDDWLLELEVQQFYGIQNSAGQTSSVRVEMAGTIECNGDTHPLQLAESNSVSEDHLAAVVAAHQRGLNGVTRQLLKQMSEACS